MDDKAGEDAEDSSWPLVFAPCRGDAGRCRRGVIVRVGLAYTCEGSIVRSVDPWCCDRSSSESSAIISKPESYDMAGESSRTDRSGLRVRGDDRGWDRARA